MAELADALDLKSSAFGRKGSSPFLSTWRVDRMVIVSVLKTEGWNKIQWGFESLALRY